MALHSGIVHPQHSAAKEDVFSNPFYEFLRQEYEHLLTSSALIVLPSSSILQSSIPKSVYSTKKFAESHILLSAHIPGLFCSVRGHPVEQRGDRLITSSTNADSSSSRNVSTITQSENMYDFGNAFKVAVVDRPLVAGDWTGSSAGAGGGSPVVQSGGGPSEYLSCVPLVESDIFEKLVKLRRTYILTPGFETLLASRIKDLSTVAANQVARYLTPAPPVPVIQADIERAAYATLHAWIYPHLVDALGDNANLVTNVTTSKSPDRVEHVLREMQSSVAVLSNYRTLMPILESELTPLFAKLAQGVTPQQKINYLTQIVDKIESIYATNLKMTEFGAEEVLAALAVAVILCGYLKGPVDIAYAGMLLSCHPELAGEKGAFSVATFNTCIEFFAKAIL